MTALEHVFKNALSGTELLQEVEAHQNVVSLIDPLKKQIHNQQFEEALSGLQEYFKTDKDTYSKMVGELTKRERSRLCGVAKTAFDAENSVFSKQFNKSFWHEMRKHRKEN